MKTTHIFLLLVFTPFISFGQINQSIDIIGGLDYSYRNLTSSSDESLTSQLIESLSEDESGILSWRFGANYNKKITNKLFLKTGLRLASVGYKGLNNTDLRWGSQHDGMGGFDPSLPSNEPSEVQFTYNFWFIDIPIAVRYEVNQKKFSPFFELGVSPSIYITTRTRQETNLDTSTSSFDETRTSFNRLNLVGFASVGFNYNLCEKLQIFAQPIFRYHLTSSREGDYGEHLFTAGLELGVRKNL